MLMEVKNKKTSTSRQGRVGGQHDPKTLTPRSGVTTRLAVASARRSRRVIAGWLLILILAVGYAATSLHGLTSSGYVVGSTESSQALAIYDHVTNAGAQGEPTDFIIVTNQSLLASSSAFRATTQEISQFANGSPGVKVVPENYGVGGPFVADHGHAVVIALRVTSDQHVKPVENFVRHFASVHGYAATMTGTHTLAYDLSVLSKSDLQRGETDFGLPIALLVLVLVFGSVVAGVMPVLMALTSIGVGLGIATIVAQQFTLSSFIVNMMTAMGLALGIDYALFVISRFREERRRGRSVEEAIEVSGATAGRAVLFSGGTFAVALCGILLVRTNVLRSLAAGAVIVSVVSVMAALTLLPAVLSVLGDRIDRGRLPWTRRKDHGSVPGKWHAVVQRVTARPVTWFLVASVALVALAIPALGLHLGQSGVSQLPTSTTAKQGYTLMNHDFPALTASPVKIAVRAPATTMKTVLHRLDAIVALSPTLRTPSTVVDRAGSTEVLTVPIVGDPTSASLLHTVRELRTSIAKDLAKSDVRIMVGGETAQTVDYINVVDAATPWVLLFVFAISFFLLLLAFRSLVIALLSIVLNLISIGAAYGVLTLVFLRGVGTHLFGFTRVTAIDAWIPLFLFAVLFALSMDYHVFLMSRIREHADAGESTQNAVVNGVSSTAKMITGAALIIIVVFLGFARGQLVMFQQMGFGVAVALFLDATLVRLILLPTSLTLLGERAWYLPKWLGWLPHVGIEK